MNAAADAEPARPVGPHLSPVAEVAHHAATTPGELRRWRINDSLHRMDVEMRLQRQMARQDHHDYRLAGEELAAAVLRAAERLEALESGAAS